jgi:magnesium transporter
MKTHALFREVVLFQRATKPLLQVTQSLRVGFDKYQVAEELRRRLRDVEDHLQRVADEVDGYRALLQNILAVNAAVTGQQQAEAARQLTEVSIAQNDQVKRISAWAAILFAPTLVGTVYGMNFHNMPELSWRLGYPYAFGLMAVVCLILFIVFKRKEWL